jgi:hypothetical protein
MDARCWTPVNGHERGACGALKRVSENVDICSTPGIIAAQTLC